MYGYKCKKMKERFILKYLYFGTNILISLMLFFGNSHLIKLAPSVYVTDEFYAIVLFIFAVIHLFVTKRWLKIILMFPFLLHLMSLILYAIDYNLYQYVIVLGFLYVTSITIAFTNGE